MRRAHASRCMEDADYARFTRFYLSNSEELDRDYTLHDALLNLMHTLPDSHIMLFDNDEGELIGFIQYQYGEDPDSAGVTLTIDAAILASAYRGSRVFFAGFREFLELILRGKPDVKLVQFYALADHRYLNRLYSKFARPCGVRQSSHRDVDENRYVQSMEQLLQYFRL